MECWHGRPEAAMIPNLGWQCQSNVLPTMDCAKSYHYWPTCVKSCCTSTSRAWEQRCTALVASLATSGALKMTGSKISKKVLLNRCSNSARPSCFSLNEKSLSTLSRNSYVFLHEGTSFYLVNPRRCAWQEDRQGEQEAPQQPELGPEPRHFRVSESGFVC